MAFSVRFRTKSNKPLAVKITDMIVKNENGDEFLLNSNP
jgi:hypothetical protein